MQGKNRKIEVRTVDYHTAGEPFRIVTDGVGPLLGKSVSEKRAYAMEHLDHVRRFLVNEPRGHADMYGGFVTEADDEEGDLGVVFFHNEGFSTACGHGTIALATWAIENNWYSTEVLDRKDRKLLIDVPSGRVKVTLDIEDGQVGSTVRFQNVPSFVHSRGLSIETKLGTVVADIAFGGAFYACVDVNDLGLAVESENLPTLIEIGRQIKSTINTEYVVQHPVETGLREIYGVIFVEDEGFTENVLTQRNVAIFADGEVDRSPCGSGTSARLALLHESGLLTRGTKLENKSIIGTRFRGIVLSEVQVASTPAVITEIEGNAHITGYHHFVLDSEDPLDVGFFLR